MQTRTAGFDRGAARGEAPVRGGRIDRAVALGAAGEFGPDPAGAGSRAAHQLAGRPPDAADELVPFAARPCAQVHAELGRITAHDEPFARRERGEPQTQQHRATLVEADAAEVDVVRAHAAPIRRRNDASQSKRSHACASCS